MMARGALTPAARSSSADAPSPYTTRTLFTMPIETRDGSRSKAIRPAGALLGVDSAAVGSASAAAASGSGAAASKRAVSTPHTRCPRSP